MSALTRHTRFPTDHGDRVGIRYANEHVTGDRQDSCRSGGYRATSMTSSAVHRSTYPDNPRARGVDFG